MISRTVALFVLAYCLCTDPGHARSLVETIPTIAQKAVKSVVNISSIKLVRYQTSPFMNDPFFRYFFGEDFVNPHGVPRQRREQSLGSGVIVSRQGHVLTNNHVVANADEVNVVLFDRVEVKAKVIGTDPPTDVALLQIPLGKQHGPMPLGNSDALKLAETVLAIGSPFGLGGTVTMGIVSAKGRANVGVADYEDFIQTDAAINPGNSGGALIDLEGRLVGINTAIASRTGGYQGIGFAIPINMARFVMEEIEKHGKVMRGWMGISFQEVTPEIAKAMGMSTPTGVIITQILRKSPADEAGLEPGDIILTFDGVKVRQSGHLAKLLSEAPIGKKINLLVKTRTGNKSFGVEIKEKPMQHPSHTRRLR